MKKYLTATIVALAGTAALAQTAPVAPPSPPAHPMHDGVMTRAEVAAKVREHFGRLDADRDGAITTAEASARLKHPGGAWQGENAVAHRQHKMRDPAAAFDRLDTNKDGAISRDEFAKAHERRIERRTIVKKEGGKGAHRMHRRGGIGGARMIVMADTNKDGRVTLTEAEAMALQHFDQMDANRDGQVTREERRAGRPLINKQLREPDAG